MNSNSIPSLWTGQVLHISALAILLAMTWYFWNKIGSPFPLLFWASISIPIVHQVFVWFSWRVELNSKGISNSFGLTSYLTIFFLLLVARPIIFLLLAWYDRNSLGMDIVPRTLLCLILLVPSLLTMYSVKKYFGFIRAAGGDHFLSKYRTMPIVEKGMFKYSSNSMYVFGFLMFWGIALAFDSKLALLSSAFCHVYIWIHFFATEKPDMEFLYGEPN